MGAGGSLPINVEYLKRLFTEDPEKFLAIFAALTRSMSEEPKPIKPAYPEGPSGAIGDRFKGLDLGPAEPVKTPTR